MGTLQVRDAFGNLATGYRAVVEWTSGAGQATLPAFTDLTLSAGGAGFTFVAPAVDARAVTSAVLFVKASRIMPVIVPDPLYAPTPLLSGNDAFVKGLYRLVLGRNSDEGGRNFWVNLLNGGTSRTVMVEQFWNSPENRGRQVESYYQAFLGRGPDGGGRAFWVDALTRGIPEEQIVLGFLTSDESLRATDTLFVQRLYRGALGREADQGGLDFWSQTLQRGMTRQTMANLFIRTPEAAAVGVDSFFSAYLRRNADLSSRQLLADQITNGNRTFASVAQLLLSSQEFFDNGARIADGD